MTGLLRHDGVLRHKFSRMTGFSRLFLPNHGTKFAGRRGFHGTFYKSCRITGFHSTFYRITGISRHSLAKSRDFTALFTESRGFYRIFRRHISDHFQYCTGFRRVLKDKLSPKQIKRDIDSVYITHFVTNHSFYSTSPLIINHSFHKKSRLF